MNNRDIILQGMSGYLGGNPRRVHLLDSQDIENIVRHFDLKDLRGDIKSVRIGGGYDIFGYLDKWTIQSQENDFFWLPMTC